MISAFYHRWHQHPHHPFWHRVFFSFIAILVFNHLSIRIGDYLNEEILSLSIQTPQAQAAGNTYYVSTTGNDANSCTQAQSINTPKRTIKNGILCLTPGDTLYIRSGTYPERIAHTDFPALGISWSNAVMIAGYPSEQVILNPVACEIINLPASIQYIIFDNMVLDGVNLSVSASNACVPVSLGGSDPNTVHHIRFKDLEVKNSPWNGIIGGGSYIEMLNLKVHDNGTRSINVGNGIYGTMDNSLVDGGEYYNNLGYGVRMFDSALTSTADNNIIRNIRTYNNESGGIVLSDYNNTAYNNLVYGNTFGSGIDVGSGNFSSNIKLYNNVIYNNAGYGINLFSFDGPSAIQNTQVRNNIVFANGVNSINNEGTGTVQSNNLLTDPKFVNAVANDFHLQSTSPAINAGAILIQVTTDFDGVSRPQGSAYDIGAYEYGGTVTTPTPTPTTGAKTYYVSTIGNDANSCTQAQNISTPKKTIAAGLACMMAGDTLYIRAGTYNEGIYPDNGFIPRGTSWVDAPRIAAYPGEKVVITKGIGFYGVNFKYLIFDGLTLDGGYNSGDLIWISLGAGYMRFTNLEVLHSNGSGGVQLPETGAGHNEFINCKVHDNGIRAGYDHGFYISSNDNLVQNCDVYNNAAYGVHVYSGTPSNNIVRNNRIYNNGVLTQGQTATAFGLLLTGGSNNQAYNNLIYNNTSGIQVGGSNAKIYHNLVYGNTSNGYPVIQADTSSGAIIKNNIFWQNFSNSISFGINTIQSNNLTTDPKFVNAAANDFHLQSTSPAINAGAILSEVPTDFDGVSRPQGNAYDIGAYEYGGVVTTPTSTLTLTPSPTLTPTPIVVANKSTYIPGETITVIANGGANNVQEWVAVYLSSNPDSSWSIGDNYWKYLNGTQTVPVSPIPYPATMTFAAPSTSGTYNIRYFAYNGYANRLAVSNNLIVTASFSSCDLNQDSQTNILDFQLLANVILGITPNPGGSDINKDGQINILDTQVLANVILGKSNCP